jgi:putative aminopeptidase FrvX
MFPPPQRRKSRHHHEAHGRRIPRVPEAPAGHARPSGAEAGRRPRLAAGGGGFADRVYADVSGNSVAIINEEGSPRIMLAGHIDEIGVMVTHIDDEGFVYFEGVGGWDSQVLVGQRIRLLTRKGHVMGVVGKKPIHLMKNEEKDKVSKIEDLWIDVGAKDRAAAAARGVRVGDAGVIDSSLVELGDDLIASRSVDNRIGAYIVLEALRLLARTGPPPWWPPWPRAGGDRLLRRRRPYECV